jgi:uncharacterized protein YndB with AHSA1/START domain
MKAQMSRPSGHEIMYTRTINAPRELVFIAWSDPKHLAHWYGPDGFTLTTHEMDFREGGFWRFIMHGPDGRDYKNTIQYLEIKAPERIVHNHVGEEGEEPVIFKTTVTFEALTDKTTRFTMLGTFNTPEALQYVIEHHHADEGGMQTTDRLGEYAESLSQ